MTKRYQVLKRYRLQYRIGRARYVVSFHDGRKRHPDGSAFWDIRIFGNRRVCQTFLRTLWETGFTEARADWSGHEETT